MGDEKILVLAGADQFNGLAGGVFKGLPLTLFQADTLEGALVMARRERPELILIYAGLPGLDASEGCAAFKQDGEISTTPVVVVASGDQGEAELFRKAGCDDCLVMPMERSRLLSYLHRYLPGLQLQHERAPYYSQVTIRDDGDVFYGMTGDISGGGLFVATFDRLPAEGEIQLSFNLPDDKTTLVEKRGRVVWLNSKDHPVSPLPEGFGVEFMSVTREEYLAIKEYIAATRKNPTLK